MLHSSDGLDICAAHPNDGGWQECRSPDGFPYWWNWVTQETTWDEPRDELPVHPYQA